MNSSLFKNPPELLNKLKTKPENYFLKRGEKMALELFQQMSRRVPAYKSFLKKNKIDPKKITTISDFKKVPTISKDNYLRVNSLEDLCWDGVLNKKRWTFSTTSGSTGEPFYFPREDFQDKQYALTAELYLRSNFDLQNKSTIYIDGFAMGAWIGGLFTYEAIKILAERGNYNLSIITPGSSKEEIIKAVRNIGKKFDQIIIGGYPPFVKDLIDFGSSQGLNWKDYNLGFIFSAEGFSEAFRDYIINKTGLKNPFKDTLNHYGTVDLGTMSHETPICILLRRLALINDSLNSELFADLYKQPTLTQYLPEMFFFEEVDGGLVCSAFSGLPLVRYDLKDQGGVISFKEMFKKCQNTGIDLLDESSKQKIDDTIWNLPFVFVHERSDFIVKLCGANIYPQTIRKALTDVEAAENLSGKFTAAIKYDKNQDQYMELNIELKIGSNPTKTFSKLTRDIIVKYLLKENSEYKYLYTNLPKKQVLPKIIFWEYGSKPYFKSGGKQKWIKKN